MVGQSFDTGANIGGASNIVSQIVPVFAYPAERGYIYVYLVRTWYTKVAIATYYDGSSEYAFAIDTVNSGGQFEAEELISEAEKQCVFIDNNPFRELHEDDGAMDTLAKLLSDFYMR